MQKGLMKLATWLLCLVMFTGAVACSGGKSASGKKSPGIETPQQKQVVTDCLHREKPGSSLDCAPDNVVVENNYLSSQQIDNWSAEMKSCQASGGDCGGIIKKYEELSTAQQQQLISDCASNPASCQQKYGDVLTDSLAVKQAIDHALGEDIPIKMVYDLTATFAQQMQAEGVVATQKVSEALQKEYGLDEVQAGIVASAAASAFGGISKAGKGSPLPTPKATTAKNGLNYQSNPKHTPGQQGYSFNAGTEPTNSIDLFGSSVVSGKKRYSIDSQGNVHQFTNTNDGTWHWSGSTGDKTVPLKKSDIPNSVKKEFGLPGKWR